MNIKNTFHYAALIFLVAVAVFPLALSEIESSAATSPNNWTPIISSTQSDADDLVPANAATRGPSPTNNEQTSLDVVSTESPDQSSGSHISESSIISNDNLFPTDTAVDPTVSAHGPTPTSSPSISSEDSKSVVSSSNSLLVTRTIGPTDFQPQMVDEDNTSAASSSSSSASSPTFSSPSSSSTDIYVPDVPESVAWVFSPHQTARKHSILASFPCNQDIHGTLHHQNANNEDADINIHHREDSDRFLHGSADEENNHRRSCAAWQAQHKRARNLPCMLESLQVIYQQ
jgi:hypothetical protein